MGYLSKMAFFELPLSPISPIMDKITKILKRGPLEGYRQTLMSKVELISELSKITPDPADKAALLAAETEMKTEISKVTTRINALM